MVSIFFVAAGLGISSMGLFDLGKSFSVLPAARELKTEGIYKIVRHPIYLGYILNGIGILILYPTVLNFALLLCFVICQVWRIKLEEDVLCDEFSTYKNYRSVVKFKLFFYVY
jgi:protein-S-isoprenylcysteine O-methyltransferase Ste14